MLNGGAEVAIAGRPDRTSSRFSIGVVANLTFGLIAGRPGRPSDGISECPVARSRPLRQERPPLGTVTDIAWYEAHFEALIRELDARMRGVMEMLDQNGDAWPSRTLGAHWNTSSDVPNPGQRVDGS